MSIIMVSDLHIWGPDDPLYKSLLSLLRSRTQAGDVVVLAGDLFDLFVGDKPVFTSRYREFLDALQSAGVRGVHLHYIEGNHDFFLKKVFSQTSGLSLHSKEVKIEMGGKRFYFSHGDLVDSHDYGYLAMRAFFRSPIMKALVYLIPGDWLDWIGRTSSQKSRKRKPVLPAELPLGSMENLRKTYRSFAAERMAEGSDFVVLGHCHDLDEMFFNIGGRSAQYINIGYPRVHGSFLSWTPGEERIQRERLP